MKEAKRSDTRILVAKALGEEDERVTDLKEVERKLCLEFLEGTTLPQAWEMSWE